MKYVTMLGLTVTENLGSQLMHFFCLYAIAKKTGHRVAFLDQYANLGRGLKLNLPFEALPFDLIDVNKLTDEERVYSIYPIDLQVPVSSGVFSLDRNININFQGYFTSYRYWYPIREELLKFVKFKKDIKDRAALLLQPLKQNGKEVVSIHVRRADYIENGVNTPNGTLPYFNPSTKYYEEAVSLFSEKDCTFIVFSDDIPWCKSAFKAREDFVFSEGESAEVDLCAMSLCDHNIITNSSFSFLSAVLNKNPSRKVICPGKYMKHDNVIKHVNHCWFPDDYIPLVVE